MSEKWGEIGWIKSSNNRSSIIYVLYEAKNPMTPKEISEELDKHLSQISNILGDLSEKEIVECLTPDRKRGRLYHLTEKGRKYIKEM